MDTEIDFLRADLLYQILIADRSLVIEPFTISAKLTPLKNLIETLYEFKELDPQMLNDLELSAIIFDEIETANLDSTTTKYMAFIAGGTDEILNITVQATNVESLILKKTISNPNDHTSLVFYNKKTNELSNGTTVNADAIAWCQNVIDMVNEGSLEDAIIYLKHIRQAIQKLFELSTDFSLNHYIALMTAYSARDQRIIRKLCENMFLIDLSSIAPESLGQDLMNEISISPHDRPNEEDFEIINDIQHNEDEIFQLASELPEEIESKSQIPEILTKTQNDPHIMEYQHFIMNSPEYTAVFEIAIDDAQKQYQLLAATPEMSYTLLRKKQWSEKIPSSFFSTMLRFVLIDIVTRNKMGNFIEVAKKEGQKLHDACEGLPGLPALIGTTTEIQELEQDPEISPKLRKHNVSVLPVLPENKKVSNSTVNNKIIIQDTPSDSNSISVSKEKFVNQLKKNTQSFNTLPKRDQMAFFTTKLTTIKQKLFS